MKLQTYISIALISLQSGLVYRTNIFLWRIRNVLRFLTIYFFWQAAYSHSDQVLGYSYEQVMTYAFVTTLIWPFIFATKTESVAVEIANGELAQYLLRPVRYLHYWASREAADKVINTVFGVLEIAFLFWVFKPPITPMQNVSHICQFIVMLLLALVINFLINFLTSLSTFWLRENNGWPVRFLFNMLLMILSGGVIPLDMYPPLLYKISLVLPTSYIMFVPMQVWLGRLTPTDTFIALCIMCFWIITLYCSISAVWNRGIRIYESEGR